MGAVFHNPLVFMADFIWPLLVALVSCLRWGRTGGRFSRWSRRWSGSL